MRANTLKFSSVGFSQVARLLLLFIFIIVIYIHLACSSPRYCIKYFTISEMTLLILRQSKSPFGPGSIDTEVPDWLNQHEKLPFNCQETSSWVGLPEWLFLWLSILFLFGRAGPKIAIFPPLQYFDKHERENVLHLQWRLSFCIPEESEAPRVFLSSGQPVGFWALLRLCFRCPFVCTDPSRGGKTWLW